MKDTQRDAVYAWETDWADWNRETLTLATCRGYIAVACKLFNLDLPTVRQHRTKAASYSCTTETAAVISFHLQHKNPAIALHEAAHYIHSKTAKRPGHDHGPTWLGIYMTLLIVAQVAPKAALFATARKHGLRWVWPKEKPPEGG